MGFTPEQIKGRIKSVAKQNNLKHPNEGFLRYTDAARYIRR